MRENRFLGTWVPKKAAMEIGRHIEEGVFLNYADFLRQATRNELERLRHAGDVEITASRRVDSHDSEEVSNDQPR